MRTFCQSLLTAARMPFVWITVLVLIAPVPSLRSQPTRVSGPAADVRRLLDRGLYDQAENLAGEHFRAVRRTNGEQSLDTADSADLLVRALVLNGKGGLDPTLALAEETVRSRESDSRSTGARLALSLTNLGNALSAATLDARAIAVHERAVAIHDADADPCSQECLESLTALGAALTRAGRYRDAIPALQRSLAAHQEVDTADVRSLANTLQTLALAFHWSGDYAAARTPLERALSLQAALELHPLYVDGLALLGQQYWYEGDLLRARDASASAVDVAERTLRPDHPVVGRSLRSLAATLLDLGDIAQARSLQERALAIMERSLGRHHAETAACLNGLAESEMLSASYIKARTLYERALTIAEAKLGDHNDSVATFVHNLALVNARLGDYDTAMRENARALAIWERVFNPNHPIVGVSLTELATVLRERGLAREALPLLLRALAIREQGLVKDHRDVARTLADLAATLAQLGQTDLAQSYSARALVVWEGLNAALAPDFATVLALHADLQAAQGHLAVARDYYSRALTIRERVLGLSHPLVADIQVRLALTLARLGDAAASLDLARTAETNGREHLRLMVRYLPERQALDYAGSRPSAIDLLIALVDVSRSASTIAMDAVVRNRALVLDEMASRHRGAYDAHDLETAPLMATLTVARQRLANVVVRGPVLDRSNQYLALVESARLEKERLERELAAQSAAFNAALVRPEVGLKELSASLPRGSALISYVSYEAINALTRAGSVTGLSTPATPAPDDPAPVLQPVTSYLAFVLRPGELDPIVVPLGQASIIDGEIARWRTEAIAGLSRPGGRTRADRSLRAIGESLRRRVWDPLEPHLRAAEQVFVVPEGSFNLLPLAALPVGSDQYLLERGPTIHYLSAERDIAAARERPSTGSGLLAFGGAAFGERPASPSPIRALDKASEPSDFRGTTSTCVSFQSLDFTALPASGREASDIARLWKEVGAGSEQLLVGPRADERRFKQLGPGSRVLHLATHGFFLGGLCASALDGTRSVGGLAPRAKPALFKPTVKRPQAPKAQTSVVGPTDGENPLVLSGLAMAGANLRAAASVGEDDGILTSEEVAAVNLSGVEWAVLSACDTGLGEIKAGEGVFGLRRAFQIAGAHTVIMSLWSVEDQAAMTWMRALYEGRLVRKLDTANAVREASLAVLRQRRARGQSTHPFFWAGFVASGDWR